MEAPVPVRSRHWIKEVRGGQQDGRAWKGANHQTRQLKFDLRGLHGGKREPVVCSFAALPELQERAVLLAPTLQASLESMDKRHRHT